LEQNIYKSGPSDIPSGATLMTLALMLPNKPLVASSTPGDDQEKYLRYAQFLTNIGGSTVMRVDGNSVVVNPDYLKLYSMNTVTSSVFFYDSTTASWSNSWTLLKSIDSLNNDPSDPVTGSHIPSAQTLLYQKNREGYVRSAPVSCP